MKFALALILSVFAASWAVAEDSEAPSKRAVYHNISPAFVSNFGFSEKKLSYIKAEVALKIESEELLEKVKQNEALVRHQIVMLLSAQTKEQMSAQAAQETIRVTALSRVKEALAEEIGKTGVQDLLFTNFVVQI
jgi:flagellar protein FliL